MNAKITTTSNDGISLRVAQACALLAEAKTIDEVKEKLAQAAAIELYTQRRDNAASAHADAYEIKAYAQRRLGELTSELPKHPTGGGRPPKAKTGDIVSLVPVSKRAALKQAKITPKQAERYEAMARLPEPEFKARVAQERERIEKGSDLSAVSKQSTYDGDEYGTPERYMLVVRELLGGIDYDPFSNAAANNIVKAERFSTKQDSSFDLSWEARTVWYQPPFSAPLVTMAADKLASEWQAQHFESAAGLTNCDPSTGWYQTLLEYSDAHCQVDHRIAFLLNGEPLKQNRYAQTFWYFGKDITGFHRLFRQFGQVCMTLRGVL
jgi:hypothetical protein